MTQTSIEIVKLTASDGMTLTNGEAYGKEVYLACNDKPENWYEITDEEYEKIKAERDEINELLSVDS